MLLEEYRARLQRAEDRQLRHSIQRVIDIFQSSLFQALIGTYAPETASQVLTGLVCASRQEAALSSLSSDWSVCDGGRFPGVVLCATCCLFWR